MNKILPAVALLGVVTTLSAATFTVTNTLDSGTGSLRQAILDANANGGLDAIQFNIAGSGVHTITPTNGLPLITDPVVIDGFTQPGTSANTLTNGDDAMRSIELNGSQAGFVAGLFIDGSNVTVRGLIINRFETL